MPLECECKGKGRRLKAQVIHGINDYDMMYEIIRGIGSNQKIQIKHFLPKICQDYTLFRRFLTAIVSFLNCNSNCNTKKHLKVIV